jgi:hypothetical protein
MSMSMLHYQGNRNGHGHGQIHGHLKIRMSDIDIKVSPISDLMSDCAVSSPTSFITDIRLSANVNLRARSALLLHPFS